jgi:hypothetical protein
MGCDIMLLVLDAEGGLAPVGGSRGVVAQLVVRLDWPLVFAVRFCRGRSLLSSFLSPFSFTSFPVVTLSWVVGKIFRGVWR